MMHRNVETKEGVEEIKHEPIPLQTLYNRRRELKRAIKDIDRRIEDEKNRLTGPERA